MLTTLIVIALTAATIVASAVVHATFEWMKDPQALVRREVERENLRIASSN